MREVTIREAKTILVASPMTPWIYEDQFKGKGDPGDMMADFMAVGDGSMNGIPKMAWAMARSACYPKAFPDFHAWIEAIGGWDFADVALIQAVMLEAPRALFPGKPGLVSQLEAKFADEPAGEAPVPELPGDGQADEALV